MRGDFFVNSECIGCETCVDLAPNHFAMRTEVAHVKRQPQTKSEIADCMEARRACPVEAIKIKTK